MQDPWDKSEHTLFNFSAPMLAVRATYHMQTRYMNIFNLITQMLISILFSHENITVKFRSDQNVFVSFSYSYLSVFVRFLGLLCGRNSYPILQ